MLHEDTLMLPGRPPSWIARSSSETRWAMGSSAVLPGLCTTSTWSSSKSPAARSITSRCPRVTGSNEPGTTAILRIRFTLAPDRDRRCHVRQARSWAPPPAIFGSSALRQRSAFRVVEPALDGLPKRRNGPEVGVRADQVLRVSASLGDQVAVGGHAEEAERGPPARLDAAEHIALPAQFQVDLGQLEPVEAVAATLD